MKDEGNSSSLRNSSQEEASQFKVTRYRQSKVSAYPRVHI